MAITGTTWSGSITNWMLTSFGHLPDNLLKAKTEFEELEKAIESGAEPEEIAKECADVVICLAGVCLQLGKVELSKAVIAKMIINRGRKWLRLADGTYQHVKGADELP